MPIPASPSSESKDRPGHLCLHHASLPFGRWPCPLDPTESTAHAAESWQSLDQFRTSLVLHSCSYRFSFSLIPGGSLIPISATPLVSFLAPVLPSSPTDPWLFSPFFWISSTLPFWTLKAGHTQTPQLHLIPCQAYRPIWALHLAFGHSRRPSKRPCSRAGRIQESGWRKWWVQTLWVGAGGKESMGPVVFESLVLGFCK